MSKLLFLFLFLLAFPLHTFSSPISLPLRLLPPAPSTTTSTAFLANLAASSLTRARHLRSPNPSLPLYPHSYGGYTVELSLGTPPQPVSLIVDTGSDLVWVPCTPSYLCRNCSFPSTSSSSSSHPFLPKSSSSSKLVGCRNPKCAWIHPASDLSSCTTSSPPTVCPPYAVLYGSGSTAGLLLSETLDLPGKQVTDFAIGCSVFSSKQPAGIAGFGRSPLSLPTQLGLDKFGYCLLSRRFDDRPAVHGSLVLGGGGATGGEGISYTPLLKNPAADGRPAFGVYYYVGLRKIFVGGKQVRIPHRYLSIASDGEGGTIVDSGTTFTVMSGPIFDLVAEELEARVGRKLHRATKEENESGLRPCYDLSTTGKNGSLPEVEVPDLTFEFKGGAQMKLPLENYFALVGPGSVACLTILTDGHVGPDLSHGPSIILGSFQQQNFYVEYNLHKQKFGFRQQNCRAGHKPGNDVATRDLTSRVGGKE